MKSRKIAVLILIFFINELIAQKPDILWYFDLKSVSFGNSCADDIDGDGKLEIVFSTYFNDETVYALNSEDGSLLWKYKTGGCNDAAPLIADVDGDGSKEVILHSSTSHYLYCFNGMDGSIKWKTSSIGTDSPPSAADINNDKILEIFGGDFYGRIISWSGENGTQLWAKLVDSNSTVQTEPVISDVNGDGDLDCVVATWKINKKNRISAYRLKDGELIWSSNEPANTLYHGPVILDLDKDNDLEVVIGSYDGYLYCLNGKDGSIKWTFNYPDKRFIGAPVTAGDLTGDGKYELAFVCGSKLGVLNSHGQLLWDYDMGFQYTSFRGSVFSDMDNLPGLDLLFGSSSGKIIALRGYDGFKIFEYDMSSDYGKVFNIDHAPIVADFNNDGLTDCFFVGGYTEYPDVEKSYGRAYMITIGKTRGPDWLMFRQNIRRNAVLPINQLTVPDENFESESISPNPALDYIDINIDKKDINSLTKDIKIYNILGECLIRVSPQNYLAQKRIDISHLSAGIYFITSNYITAKFIVVR
jgi:outer membrane protein assembly factor BamB